jgi:hypothetical protein
MTRAPAISPPDPTLRALADAIAGLRRRVDQLETDRASDRYFVTTIAAAVHGRCFSAKDLHDHAAVDDRLAAVLRSSPKRTGKRLGRVQDHVYDGVMVQWVARDKGGCIWQITYTNTTPTPSGGA